MHVPRVAISLVTIPCVAHDKLHETCMFHATSKRGPRKHVTGLFKVLSCCHVCINEVIIEQYGIISCVVKKSDNMALYNYGALSSVMYV